MRIVKRKAIFNAGRLLFLATLAFVTLRGEVFAQFQRSPAGERIPVEGPRAPGEERRMPGEERRMPGEERSPARPNILIIMADDLGFSDLGCYGGEVGTPSLDSLAAEGLRYRQFYNAARCCPSRAALMTGLYPHQAGMGWMAAADLGTPEYAGNLNDQAVTIAEVLKTAGYNTYMTGKWHLTNERKIDGRVTDNWPVHRGFDRYFGIIPGGANYFTPTVYSNDSSYKAPPGFYLTDAISDTSVKYLDEHFSNGTGKPFFMYVAYTAPHWPLHALKNEIERYKERYLQGWDVIREKRFRRQQEMGLFPEGIRMNPRDPAVPAWETLGEQEKEEMAMRMAIYAAQIDIMDQGIGRIISELRSNGQLDNTLVFFLSDNGACAEFISSGKSKAVDGTRDTFESYRINWANVGSTPFKEYKHYTHEGGIAAPLIVHWPEGIRSSLDNTFVNEYGHITDLMATCVEVSGAKYPAKYHGSTIHPLAGKSLVPHFSGGTNHRGRVFWEHEANIAVRDGRWKLVAKTLQDHEFDPGSLELYDMQADPAEMHDLAGERPELVKKMYAQWQEWAKKINVYPLDTRGYGARMQAYRRTVNGSFDDNLGGWNVRDGRFRVSVDTTGRLSGKRSARITPLNSGTRGRPGEVPSGETLKAGKGRLATDQPALVMAWSFRAKKGESFSLGFRALSEERSSLRVRLERTGKDDLRPVDEQVWVDGKDQFLYRTGKLPEEGTYRIAFYRTVPATPAAGSATGRNARVNDAAGTIWIDDVTLTPLIESSSVKPASAPASRPNMVIIMADDLDSRQLSCYGGTNIRTPHIDSLAARGMKFNQMIASEAMCIPTRASLFTGLYPARHGAYQNHKQVYDSLQSVAHFMSALGYRVGLTGKNHVTTPRQVFPFDRVPGFEPNCVSATDDYFLDSVRRYISQPGQPFCLFVMSINPHGPWTAGDPSEFDPATLTLPPNWIDTRKTRERFAAYLAEVRRLDDQVGDLVRLLKSTGKDRNTIVFFLGEQGPQFPGGKWTLWDQGQHSSMIVRWPGTVGAGTESEALVQYEDITPTLVEIAGGNPVPGLDGKSFLPVLSGKRGKHREYAFGIHNNIPEGPAYPVRSVRDTRYKLILNLLPEKEFYIKYMMNPEKKGSYYAGWLEKARNDSGARFVIDRLARRPAVEFYDLRNDPFEMNNLAGTPGYRAQIVSYRKALEAWMRRQGDPGAALDKKFNRK